MNVPKVVPGAIASLMFALVVAFAKFCYPYAEHLIHLVHLAGIL